MVIFSSNTSYFSLYNYGLGHPTLCVNLSDSSGLDHSLGSRVIAVFSKRRCLIPYALLPDDGRFNEQQRCAAGRKLRLRTFQGSRTLR